MLLLHPHTHPPLQLNLPIFILSRVKYLRFNHLNWSLDSDSITAWLLKVCASVLTPTITIIVNLSLTSGQFHPILKESVISPLVKKPTLDNSQITVQSPTSLSYPKQDNDYVRYQDCDSWWDLAGCSSSGGVKGGLRAAGLCSQTLTGRREADVWELRDDYVLFFF